MYEFICKANNSGTRLNWFGIITTLYIDVSTVSTPMPLKSSLVCASSEYGLLPELALSGTEPWSWIILTNRNWFAHHQFSKLFSQWSWHQRHPIAFLMALFCVGLEVWSSQLLGCNHDVEPGFESVHQHLSNSSLGSQLERCLWMFKTVPWPISWCSIAFGAISQINKKPRHCTSSRFRIATTLSIWKPPQEHPNAVEYWRVGKNKELCGL